MDEIKVIHVVPDGPESYLSIPGPLSVALRLVNFFPNSQLITSSTDFEKALLDSRITFSNVSVHRKYQYRNRLATGFSIGLIWRYLHLPKGSILHLHYSRSISTAIISICSLVNRKSFSVVQTHGSVKSGKSFLKKVFDYFFTRQIFRTADLIVALQENEREHLERIGADTSKLVVIPNSILPLSANEREKLDRAYSLRPQILFVGHLRPSKQVLRFFEIASLEKYSHCNFRIAGPDGGDLKNLMSNITLSNQTNTQYLGSLEWNELSRVYCDSDIILSPALDAPFDLSFLDGVARGCIGIASKEFNNWEELERIGVLIAENTGLDSLEFQLDKALHMINEEILRPRECSEAIDRVYGQEVISRRWNAVYREVGLS
jgi:glycosyltransferase involved in cell wall biosynthesis